MSFETAASTRLLNRLLRRSGLFDRINRSPVHRIAGRPVTVPIIGGVMAELTEEWMVALLRRVLGVAGSGIFVDVGVNLGQTLAKVRALDPARPYVGFEPNPVCVHYVEELIAANRWQDCRVVPAGLGQTTGVATLHLYHGRGGDSSASVIADFRPDEAVTFRKSIVILGDQGVIADLLAERVAVIKIDVEGAESDVLAALEPVIARDAPLVSMEILPCYDSERTDRIARQAAIEALLARHDYQKLRVHHAGRGGSFDLEPIDAIGIHGNLDHCEYVMVPRPRLADMQDQAAGTD